MPSVQLVPGEKCFNSARAVSLIRVAARLVVNPIKCSETQNKKYFND